MLVHGATAQYIMVIQTIPMKTTRKKGVNKALVKGGDSSCWKGHRRNMKCLELPSELHGIEGSQGCRTENSRPGYLKRFGKKSWGKKC